jgi:hypothetical protein
VMLFTLSAFCSISPCSSSSRTVPTHVRQVIQKLGLLAVQPTYSPEAILPARCPTPNSVVRTMTLLFEADSPKDRRMAAQFWGSVIVAPRLSRGEAERPFAQEVGVLTV